MSVKVFDALEATISNLGEKSDSDTQLSELSLVVNGDEKVVAFSLLGLDLMLMPSGEVAMIEEGEDGEFETSALADDLRKSVYSFLAWRVKFANEYGL